MSSLERIDEEHWRFRAACQGERGALLLPPAAAREEGGSKRP